MHDTIFKKNADSRDLTVNALFCDEKGNVLDPLDRIGDINNPELRIIGNIEERIDHDIKIILRLIHYHFYLKKELPQEYITAIQKQGHRLTHLPLKVYMNYMNKLFLKDEALPTLNFLKTQDLLKHVWPKDEDIANALTQASMENIFDTFFNRYQGEIDPNDRRCLVKRMASIAWHSYRPSLGILPSLTYLPQYKGEGDKKSPVDAVNESLHLLEITRSPKQCPG